jgi:NAD(P)-dependent dehydrogenase (short-subunit alcohol dehydrogenase family)
MSAKASELLREGLLEGVVALLAGGGSADGPAADAIEAVREQYERLGARVLRCEPPAAAQPLEAQEAEVEAEVTALLEQAGAIDVLVLDAGALYHAGQAVRAGAPGEDAPGGGGRDALSACLQQSWVLTRALAARAFLERERPGRILYLAPSPDAGVHAPAACAGLENLARTLSIEWARRQVTAVAIAPGERTAAGELAALCAYLASPAGSYFSGCLLDLRGPAGGR